jgi:hypothetical protein
MQPRCPRMSRLTSTHEFDQRHAVHGVVNAVQCQRTLNSPQLL